MPNNDSLANKTIGRVVRKLAHITSTVGKAVATLSVRTDKSRWLEVSKNPNPEWDPRNKLISNLIPADSSVLDLGCGAQTLKRYLSPGCKYQPCDVIKSTPEVIFCDFNEGIYPDITTPFDYVICSGVLEYMRDPEDFLSRISKFGSKVILSYNPARSDETKIARLAKGWLNHFTQNDLEELFRKVGLTFKIAVTRDAVEVTYELAKHHSANAVSSAETRSA